MANPDFSPYEKFSTEDLVAFSISKIFIRPNKSVRRKSKIKEFIDEFDTRGFRIESDLFSVWPTKIPFECDEDHLHQLIPSD